MSLQERLGTRGYVQYINYRAQRARELTARAARVSQDFITRGRERAYQFILTEIRDRGIVPRNVPRRENVLQTFSNRPRTVVGYVDSLDALERLETARVGEFYGVRTHRPGVRVSGPTSNWRIRPRTITSFYQVREIVNHPAPFPTKALLDAEVERRLAANPFVQLYRQERAQRDVLVSRAANFKVLG